MAALRPASLELGGDDNDDNNESSIVSSVSSSQNKVTTRAITMSTNPLLFNDDAYSINNNNNNSKESVRRHTLNSMQTDYPTFYDLLLPLRRLMRALALHSESRPPVPFASRLYPLFMLVILIFPWINYVSNFGHAKNTVKNVVVFGSAHILFLACFVLGRRYFAGDHLVTIITDTFTEKQHGYSSAPFPAAPSMGENLTLFRHQVRRVLVQFSWIVTLTVLCYVWFIVAFSGDDSSGSNVAGIIVIDVLALVCTAVSVAQFAFVCLLLKMVLHFLLLDVQRHLALFTVPRRQWSVDKKALLLMPPDQVLFIRHHIRPIADDYIRLGNAVNMASRRFRLLLLVCFGLSFVGFVLSVYEMLNTIHDHKHSGSLSRFEDIVVYVPNFLTFYFTMSVLGLAAKVAHKSKQILRKAAEYRMHCAMDPQGEGEAEAGALVSLIQSRPIYFSLYGIIVDRATGFSFLSPLMAVVLFLLQRALG